MHRAVFIDFAFATLHDWLKKFAQIFHPIRSKTKTNRDSLARVFPRFASTTCNYLGPVHTNPFSNENGAVLLRFQKDLPPHLSFSYRFRPSTLQRRICLKTLLFPQCAWSNELNACAFQYIGPRNWRENEATR